jgi:hypothetical protein
MDIEDALVQRILILVNIFFFFNYRFLNLVIIISPQQSGGWGVILELDCSSVDAMVSGL